MHKVVQHALARAKAQVGVREIGSSNTGKMVRLFQSYTTLTGTGWPWCAAFDAYSINGACAECKTPDVWLPSADCDALLQWARKRDLLRTEPAPGFAFLVMATGSDATHTGLCCELLGGGRFGSFEGNTNNDGSANGNGVYHLTNRDTDERRHDGSGKPRYLFIDWPELLPDTPTGWVLNMGGKPVVVDGKPFVMPLIDGVSFVPVRLWYERLGFKVLWDNHTQNVFYTDAAGRRHDVPAPITHLQAMGDGAPDACAELNKLVAADPGLRLQRDYTRRAAIIGRA